MASKTVMVWFRKALRVHDNATLANLHDAAHVIPVFVFDPKLTTREYVGDTRLRFLLTCLEDLKRQLESLGSSLVLLEADGSTPGKDVVSTLQAKWADWGVDELRFESDLEPYARKRDAAVVKAAKSAGVSVSPSPPHLLIDHERYESIPDSEFPRTYRGFLSLLDKKKWEVDAPLDAPEGDSFPPLPNDVSQAVGEGQFGVPGMDAFSGRSADAGAAVAFEGGETKGLERMEAFLADVEKTVSFEKPKTDPFALDPIATTGLSPFIKFGAVSVRLMFHRLREVEAGASGSVSQPPQSLVGQLFWREFFTVSGSRTANFDQMEGNQLCRTIPWGDDPGLVSAWAEGKTGFPLVDAIMRQLQRTGWIHHLSRHVVACFLTRGYLWQHWEAGKKVFEVALVDSDHFLNAANWLWLSASAPWFSAYFRVYSPVTFGKKYKQSARDYVRHWVPEVANLPDKHLFAPFDAPSSVLASAGIELGTDYPFPIVDHAAAKEANLKRMKAAYAFKAWGGESLKRTSQVVDDAVGGEVDISYDSSSHATSSSSSSSSGGKRKRQKTLDFKPKSMPKSTKKK